MAIPSAEVQSVAGQAEVVIALSPHLDDAVFSIGGFLAKCAKEGRRVIVASVYTQSPPQEAVPARFRRLLVHEERKCEDMGALAIIGAEPLWLEFTERATMAPSLGRFLGVMSLPEAGLASSFRQLHGLAERIESLMRSFPGSVVLSPFGVGTHIDHAETFLATLEVCIAPDNDGRFAFYEDVYAVSLRARRRHPYVAVETWSLGKSPLLGDCKACAMFGAIGMAGRGTRLIDLLPAGSAQFEWDFRPVSISDTENLKVEASLAYGSQIRKFGGARVWEKTFRRYHRLWGVAEPFWVPIRTIPVSRPQLRRCDRADLVRSGSPR